MHGVGTDFAAHIRRAPLADETKAAYLDRLKGFEAYVGKPMFAVLRDAKPSIAAISAAAPVPTTRKNYLALAMALFKHVPGLREQLRPQHEAWREAYEAAAAVVADQYKANRPSQKQADGYVPFDEIVAARDRLPPGSADRLLLAMYTHIHPMRADYGAVRLYRGAAPPARPEPNHLHLRPGGGCRLVVAEYKTARHHGPLEKDLPPALCEEVRASLEARPRDYLFETRMRKPYANGHQFTEYASRALKRLFGRPLTIGIIRHAFVSSLDFNKLSIAEKERIAREMGHTARMQDEYRLIFTPTP